MGELQPSRCEHERSSAVRDAEVKRKRVTTA